ncbi:MAG: hypothetical protein ACRENX_11025 [Candidatus Dormibacteria bacterium]
MLNLGRSITPRNWAVLGGVAIAMTIAACGTRPFTGGASPKSSPETSAAVAPSRTLVTALTASWPTYHVNVPRTGDSPDTPSPHSPHVAWAADLDGSVYGEPLDVGGMAVRAADDKTVILASGSQLP